MKAPLQEAVKRALRVKSDSKPAPAQVWSIGIYVGESPLVLSPLAENPVLTSSAVSDVPAAFVADPFMLKVAGLWHMFFEVMNCRSGKGEIGLAESRDGLQWKYRQIVLREEFHLSYPYVFVWKNDYYMIPESCQVKSVRLYKAVDFPTVWSFERDLLTGDNFQDSSIFRLDNRWWILTDVGSAPYCAGMLRLFYAEDLEGPWTEHPKSPVVIDDPHISRPAGRVLLHCGRAIRYTQECAPVYGSQVRAFEITELTTTSYHEREVDESPVLRASGVGWNQFGMHHIDPHPTDGGRWIASVDGFVWQSSSANLTGESKLRNNAMTRLKDRLRGYKPYIVASEIKWVLKKYLNDTPDRNKTISLRPHKPGLGNVLLAYLTDAFLLEDSQTVSYSHPAYWESLQMAKTFIDLGYCVDVISAADADGFTPEKKYAFYIGHRYNFVRIAQRLNADCVKVLHCDMAHPLFNNAANMSRLLALQQRRGITLPVLRFDPPTLAIEHADCAVVLGNKFTVGTYSYSNKPIYNLPISAPFVYPWPERKDFEAARRNFLWFGSHGFVHKGLDLVLDAFAEMPEYHLTVCGPIDEDVEKDFKKAFHKELYLTSSIRTVGWVDVGSPQFVQIADQCAGLIYPSCSEGQSGGVITCMHAGLIPILSYESGVDVEGFGFLLQDCSVEDIKGSIRMVASLSAEALRKKARQAWEFARANHTREKFAEEYRKVVGAIISAYGGNANGVPVSTNGVGQTSDRPSVYQ